MNQASTIAPMLQSRKSTTPNHSIGTSMVWRSPLSCQAGEATTRSTMAERSSTSAKTASRYSSATLPEKTHVSRQAMRTGTGRSAWAETPIGTPVGGASGQA